MAGVLLGNVKDMMYGFGDVPEPHPESVQLASLYVSEFMIEMIKLSGRQKIYLAPNPPKSKVMEDSMMLAIRHDKRKRRRAEELLHHWHNIKSARSFDDGMATPKSIDPSSFAKN